MEFLVSSQFLNEQKLEPGTMTLVEEDHLQHMLAAVGTNNVTKKACGGSAANTMVSIAQLGGKSYYSCKIASDEMGHFFHEDLIRSGVRSNCVEEAHSGTTGQCLVMITPDAERTMNTFLG